MEIVLDAIAVALDIAMAVLHLVEAAQVVQVVVVVVAVDLIVLDVLVLVL